MRARPGPFGVLTAIAFGAVVMPNLDVFSGAADASPKTEQAECLTADNLSQEQLGNAETVIDTAAELDVPEKGAVIAIATAMQESSLENKGHGDTAGPDSRGLFQQRDAWGPRADRMDPATATEMFFTGGQQGQPGLLDIDGWQGMPVTVAAQKVQRSVFGDAYAKHESLARELVGQAGGCDT